MSFVNEIRTSTWIEWYRQFSRKKKNNFYSLGPLAGSTEISKDFFSRNRTVIILDDRAWDADHNHALEINY